MSEARRLAIAGEFTIYRAAELRDALLAVMAPGASDVTIDLHDVSDIDSAGVQLLMAARCAALASGAALTLADASEPVRDVLQLFDLAAFFGEALPPAGGRA